MSEQIPDEYDEIEREFGIEGLEDVESSEETDETTESAETNSLQRKKTFWYLLSLILLVIIGVVSLSYYALIWLPQHRAQQAARQAIDDIIQTEMIETASRSTSTPSLSQPLIEITPYVTEGIDVAATITKAYEPTPVFAIHTPTLPVSKEEDLDPLRTATVAALLTEAAMINQPSEETPKTLEPSTPITEVAFSPTEQVTPLATALPKTGWMEDVGLPSMGLIALGLIFLIFVVRILRTSLN